MYIYIYNIYILLYNIYIYAYVNTHTYQHIYIYVYIKPENVKFVGCPMIHGIGRSWTGRNLRPSWTLAGVNHESCFGSVY